MPKYMCSLIKITKLDHYLWNSINAKICVSLKEIASNSMTYGALNFLHLGNWWRY